MNATVIYGNTATFSCTVINSSDIDITWNTTAAITDLPSPIMEEMGSISTLMISDVTFDNEGDYSCVATDELGSEVSTATLSVIGKL